MKKIKIFNHDWEIGYANDETLNKVNGSSNGLFNGMCDKHHQKIYIYENLKETERRNVVIHEITHAIVHQIGTDFEKSDEETACSFMAFVYPEITRLLKDLDKWLGGGK